MKKRILLTGATGYLGSHLARALVDAGHDVVALKRRSSSLQRLGGAVSEMTFFDTEELDLDHLFSECGSIDSIIHTATCYGRNDEAVSEVFAANTEFPLRLLDAGNRAGVKTFFNTDTILDKYLNLYSLSKNQLLQWGRYFSSHEKIHFVNIKLEHFYGSNEEPTKFSAYVINSCLGNVPDLELTQGEQKRDFIHIDDVVSAYMILLEQEDRLNQPFTELEVGSGQPVSIRDFVMIVHDLAASKTRLNFGSLPYRNDEVMHSEADISVLEALGWKCRYNLAAGLKQVIEQERGQI